MKKKRVLKKFIEQDMGNILRERLSPEEFNAVMQGIFMVMDEVAAGNITTVYDVMDMAARFTKPSCSGCKQREIIALQDDIIISQNKLLGINPYLKIAR